MKKINGEVVYYDCLEMQWMPMMMLPDRLPLLYAETRF